MEANIQLLSQITISFISIVIGQWLAVKLALKRFRQEKWWERETEFFASLLKAMATLRYIKATTANSLDDETNYFTGVDENIKKNVPAALLGISQAIAVGSWHLEEDTVKALRKVVASHHFSPSIDETEYARELGGHVSLIDDAIHLVVRDSKNRI